MNRMARQKNRKRRRGRSRRRRTTMTKIRKRVEEVISDMRCLESKWPTKCGYT